MHYQAGLRITCAYLIFGFAWILLSDRILEYLLNDPALWSQVQTVKGWLFVLFTGALLYSYSNRIIKKELSVQLALVDSESKFRAVFDNTFQFSGIADIDGRMIMANRAALEFIGAQKDDAVGRMLYDEPWVEPQSHFRDKVRAAVEHAAAGEFVRYQISRKSAGGQARYIDYSVKPIFGGNGQISFLVMEGRDITDLIHAKERALEVLAFSSMLLIKYNCRTAEYEYVSPAFEEIIGFTAKEFKTSSRSQVLARIHRDDIDAYEGQTAYLLGKSRSGGQRRVVLEIRMRHKSGEYRWLRVERTAVFDQNGAAESIYAVYRDISREKEAEAKLAETQALLSAAIEQSQTGIVIVDAPQGRIRLANSAALSLRGPARESLTGVPLSRFAEDWQTFHPDGTPCETKDLPLSRAILLGQVVHNQEFIIPDSDHSQRFVLANASPVRNRDNQVVAGVLVFQEITERKAFENELRNYEHLVSISRDLLALVDTNLTLRAVSSAFAGFFGKARDEVIGSAVQDIDPSFYEEHFKAGIKACLAGSDVHKQFWATFPQGATRFVDLAMYPHFESGRDRSRISGFVISARDMTDYKKLEDQLRQAYKMEAIGTLAGGIAHDFNNILSAVIGYSELTLSMVQENEEVHSNLVKILQAGYRASDLVRQILAFSRQAEQEIKPLRLRLIIKEALKLIRASLPATVAIKHDIKSESYVLADPTHMHQIIMNLCANAAYAMKDAGGILKVRLIDSELGEEGPLIHPDLAPGRYVRLVVTDTGRGMPPEIRDRIFDPFFTTKPKNQGTGMGLSLVHGIVTGSHGAITVSSEPGRGSTFNVFLPEVQDAAVEDSEAAAEPLPVGNERILLVDDEQPLVEIGERMLERLGYRVTPVVNSEKAFALFADHPEHFDLVITDLAMPVLPGDQLVMKLRQVRPEIPILMVTGYSEKLSLESLRALGIQKILLKPILMRDLAEAIRHVLNGDQPDGTPSSS